MDLRSNPFPGTIFQFSILYFVSLSVFSDFPDSTNQNTSNNAAKHQPQKPKPNWKMIEASKITSKEPAISRTATEKQAIRPSIGVPQKQPQRTRPARPRHVTEVTKKNPPENAKPKLNERTLRHQEEESGEKTPIAGPRTPVDSPSLSQPKTEGSTYRSAKICSKCRFDRLETSSYWLAQIKLAESVGKHFVSASFFRLALESKAEVPPRPS
ncbi:hypothetical protein TorRG33x02_234200 [Trema orientale]|uniref:Uncharacterized protein n=1 Tax=Trema orientale TaxID=63057 RepID=A0A2P5E4D4_TREOI|nr:hypothetical protein TorRG33x02_234200 [Trema orientale]